MYLSGLNMMAAISKGYGWRQNPEAKLKFVGGVTPRSNQQEADPTSSHVKSVIISQPLVVVVVAVVLFTAILSRVNFIMTQY